jgi:type IV secretory pathway TraG/TraD family ATPase VirD4
VNATLPLPADRVRRRWLLLDEVASLGRVQSLSDALTKGRKYGLCSMKGLQSVSQLRDVYGKDGAQTLLSCLSSQLIMRANDPETAEYASQHLGECEVLRESIAQGKHRTVTEQRHVERLVLGSEIQGLPNRIGYLRLSGQDIVRRVKIPLIKRGAERRAVRGREAEDRGAAATSVALRRCGFGRGSASGHAPAWAPSALRRPRTAESVSSSRYYTTRTTSDLLDGYHPDGCADMTDLAGHVSPWTISTRRVRLVPWNPVHLDLGGGSQIRGR